MKLLPALFLILSTILPLTQPAVAGGWTLSKGKLWIKSTLIYQSTNARFCTQKDAESLAFQQVGCTETGHSAPFDPFIGGKLDALGVFTEAIFGLTDRLNAGIKLPFYSIRFTNLADPNRPKNNSIGDLWIFGKYRVISTPLVSSIQFGVKSPTGGFNPDAEIINVSEGQWDYEFLSETSKSFWPVPVYVSLGIGYRVRSDNPDFEHTLGNEFNLIVEAGYQLSKNLGVKGFFDWLRGNHPTLFATGNRELWRRELITFTPSILLQTTGIWIETGLRLPITGEDFPDSRDWMIGLSYETGLLD